VWVCVCVCVRVRVRVRVRAHARVTRRKREFAGASVDWQAHVGVLRSANNLSSRTSAAHQEMGHSPDTDSSCPRSFHSVSTSHSLPYLSETPTMTVGLCPGCIILLFESVTLIDSASAAAINHHVTFGHHRRHSCGANATMQWEVRKNELIGRCRQNPSKPVTCGRTVSFGMCSVCRARARTHAHARAHTHTHTVVVVVVVVLVVELRKHLTSTMHACMGVNTLQRTCDCNVGLSKKGLDVRPLLEKDLGRHARRSS
jgi:hypothetical protein